MAIEERARLAEKREEIFAHLGSAGILPALSGMLPDSLKRPFLREPPAECRRQRAECSRSPRRKIFAIKISVFSQKCHTPFVHLHPAPQ